MNDEELLARLALAFAPEIGAVPQPPPHAMAALQQALAERGNGGVGSVGNRRPTRARRRLMAALAGLVATLGGATAAFAAGVPMPDPLRDLAHDVGLPVDSSTLVEGKSIRSALESAVSRRDSAAAGRLAKSLRVDLAQLDGDERAQLQAGADGLLQQADALVAGTAGQGAGGTGGPAIGSQQNPPDTTAQQPTTDSGGSGPQAGTQSESQAPGGSSSAADALLSSTSSPFPATTAEGVSNAPASGGETGGASGAAGAQ